MANSCKSLQLFTFGYFHDFIFRQNSVEVELWRNEATFNFGCQPKLDQTQILTFPLIIGACKQTFRNFAWLYVTLQIQKVLRGAIADDSLQWCIKKLVMLLLHKLHLRKALLIIKVLWGNWWRWLFGESGGALLWMAGVEVKLDKFEKWKHLTI